MGKHYVYRPESGQVCLQKQSPRLRPFQTLTASYLRYTLKGAARASTHCSIITIYLLPLPLHIPPVNMTPDGGVPIQTTPYPGPRTCRSRKPSHLRPRIMRRNVKIPFSFAAHSKSCRPRRGNGGEWRRELWLDCPSVASFKPSADTNRN